MNHKQAFREAVVETWLRNPVGPGQQPAPLLTELMVSAIDPEHSDRLSNINPGSLPNKWDCERAVGIIDSISTALDKRVGEEEVFPPIWLEEITMDLAAIRTAAIREKAHRQSQAVSNAHQKRLERARISAAYDAAYDEQKALTR